MRKQGIRPSRVTYTAAVVGINRRRYGSWAPKLANLARLLQNGPGTEAGGPVNAKIVDEVEAGGGGSGGERGDRGGPSPEELDCSIEALGDADDAGGATSLLRVMRREGFHASPRAYRSVIYACARVGLLTEAMALAKEMHSSSSSAVATQRRQKHQQREQQQQQQQQQQDQQLGILLSSSNGEDSVDGVDASALERPPAEVAQVACAGLAGPQTKRGSAAEEKRRKPRGFTSEEASLEGGVAEDGAAAEGDSERGVVSEDEDGAEFDLAVVYNCIICNFARAATGGCSTVSHACDPRSGREPPEAAVLATAEKAAAAASTATATTTTTTTAAASPTGGKEGGRRSGAAAVNGPRTEAGVTDGDGGEEGLVALLFGVADRAEGSLTEEAANGGVELFEEECSVPM